MVNKGHFETSAGGEFWGVKNQILKMRPDPGENCLVFKFALTFFKKIFLQAPFDFTDVNNRSFH